MATDLGQAKTAPTAKYETYVKVQLARTEQRIRNLDLAAALLAFAAGTLAYAVAVALLDRFLDLPPVVRQAACVVYLLASAAYLTAFVFIPLSRRINPYFAARQLERSLPGAKNSVVNWLDLRDEDLPSAIRGAVGQRAAKDLGRADLEKAVSGRRAYWAGGVAALCTLAFLIALFTLGPGLFVALLGRAFAPFGANGTVAAPTSTRLTVVKPVDGDAVVPDDRAVEILVEVGGRVPDPKAADALRLQFRYQPSASYQSRLLELDDNGRWGVTLQAVDVKDGFWYKVTGGDAETPEYRVRLTPRLTDFKAVYEYRPYLHRTKETRTGERKIEALRGTEVDVTVHTNRDVKEGYLQFEGANGAASVTRGEVLADDPSGFRIHQLLDETGQYRICFTSAEGENCTEAQAYPLIAVPDKAPVVLLTKPAERKDKPGWVAPLQADAVLGLEGTVADDVGVAAIRLNLRVENGPALPPQEYRSGDKLKLPHGGNPTSVNYEDFVDLAKVQSPADPLFKLHPGMVLEYWLTAEDACDYPDPKKPNVGESKHYRAQIVEPLNNDKAKQQQLKDEEKKKDDNAARQDKQEQKEDQQRQDQNKKNEQSNEGAGGQGDKDKPKDGSDQGANPDDKPKDGAGDKKPGDPQKGNEGNDPNQKPDGNPDKTNPDNQPGGKDNKDLQKDLKDALNDQHKDEQGTGKNDPRQQPPGDGKDGGKQQKNDPAEAKPGPQDQPGGQHEESKAKDEGKPDPMHPQQGDEAKAGGDPKAPPDAQPGQNKQGADPKAPPDAQPGQGKDGKPDQPAQPPGADKDGGKPESQKEAGSGKPQGDPSADKGGKAEPKEGNPPNTPAGAPTAGEAKDKPAPETKAEAKGGGPENPDKDGAKAEAKSDGSQSPMGDQQPAASSKPRGTPSDKQDVAQRKPDGGGSEGEPEPDEMKPQDVADLAKDLKSDDPQKREEAEKKLRQAAQKATDAQARADAEKALKDAGINSEDVQVAENKPKEPPPNPDGPPRGPGEQPSEGKPAPGDSPPGTGKDSPQETPKDGVAKGESKGDGQPPGKPPMDGDAKKDTSPGVAKGGPGNGAAGNRHDGPQTADGPAPTPTPEKPVEQRASVLQLRKFLETVDKKLLEDARRDPEAWKKLLDEARKWRAAHPPEDDKDPLAGPQQGGGLGSTAGKVSNPDGKTAMDDPNNGARPLPPPGYRDPYKEFTKLLSPGGDK